MSRATRSLVCAFAAGLLSATAAAAGFTSEQETLFAINQQRGPIAVSADGRWLAWVDAANVLHRRGVADRQQERTLAMPGAVRGLSASRTAQKVAFALADDCIGIVDFGAGASPAPTITWRQLLSLPDGRSAPDLAGWSTARPATCGGDAAAAPEAGWLQDADQLALSADGRLLATPDGVVDLDARRVVFLRPRTRLDGRADTVLRLRLLERDTRLAVVSISMGERDEAAASPSSLQAAAWDLPTRALWAHVELADADLATPQGQFADILPGGVFQWGDATGRKRPGADDKSLVDLVQWNAAACGQVPARRAALQPWQWLSFVADPRGRWIAGMRKVERTGATDELVVADLATGRTLVQRAFKHEVHGLVASPDGATLYGLSARSVRLRGDGLAPEPVGAAVSVGEVIETPIPLAGVAAAVAPAAWPARPCLEPGEAPDARRVEHGARVLAPAWTVPLAPEPRPGSGGLANASGADCSSWCGSLFTLRDGSIWLDGGARLVALDPESGRALRSLPTPRSDKVGSIPMPASEGFVNSQGDTLTWRPFEAGPRAPGRRVIDVRPGFQVLRMERRGAAVLAVWVRKPDARTPRDPEGHPVFDAADYVLYDPAGRRLLEAAGREGCEACGDVLEPRLQRELAQPCHDERGPISSGHDWHAGLFGSVRAYACAPPPAAPRLVFWDGVEGMPTAATARVDDLDGPRIVAQDAGLGVVRRGNRLQVFDAVARRELGQVAVARSLEPEAIALDVPKGLLLVVSSAQEGDERRVLRAYRFR